MCHVFKTTSSRILIYGPVAPCSSCFSSHPVFSWEVWIYSWHYFCFFEETVRLAVLYLILFFIPSFVVLIFLFLIPDSILYYESLFSWMFASAHLLMVHALKHGLTLRLIPVQCCFTF